MQVKGKGTINTYWVSGVDEDLLLHASCPVSVRYTTLLPRFLVPKTSKRTCSPHMQVKGKGTINTYWVSGVDEDQFLRANTDEEPDQEGTHKVQESLSTLL